MHHVALSLLSLLPALEPGEENLPLQQRADLAYTRKELTSDLRAMMDKYRQENPYRLIVLQRYRARMTETEQRRAVRAQLSMMRRYPELYRGGQGCQVSRGSQLRTQLRMMRQAAAEESLGMR